VVTKIPRFAFEKFPLAEDRLTTQMKSVGEVMAIGRTFQESFQKAIRGLETGIDGMCETSSQIDELKNLLSEPSSNRFLFVAEAFRKKFSLEDVYDATKIDKWFLVQIQELVEIEEALKGMVLADVDNELMLELKQKGFSDARLARVLDVTENQVRKVRHGFSVNPVFKRVDTCAGEFDSKTSYFYSTYESDDECNPTNNEKVLILGGGPNRIGQGIEFDYCCVHSVLALRSLGYETIIVN
jgi:carbamoyl-phosphate synthase large subunit